MYHRKEIDGLRAVAVLPVIYSHAGLFGLSGGYVGVDIFFVISGYLITSILIEEIEGSRFSFSAFYERRARRILPVLSLVLFITTIAAFLLMPASFLKSYAHSLMSVVTFTSNVYFYFNSGYFSKTADEEPLLHTWSLAVEEQYYILFPLLLWGFWWVGKKSLTTILALLFLGSLFFSQYLSHQQSVDANFYLIFSRAFELLAGSLLAILGVQQYSFSKKSKEVLGSIGLVLIVYAILYFDWQTPIPGVYALLPVFGTLLILGFIDSTTVLGRLLAAKPLVWIGLISYSLYLWHQPLFAFLRMKTIGEPHQFQFIVAIAMTFILSMLSYRLVEKPFRNKQLISRSIIVYFSAGTTVLFLLLGIAGHLFEGYPDRFIGPSPYLKSIQFSPKREQCHTVGLDYLDPQDACRYQADNITWAAFGDSHVVEPAYALSALLKPYGQGLLHLSSSGCPPALLFNVKRPGCNDWVAGALSVIEADRSIENVLLGFRYSAFLFGDQLDAYPNTPNIDPIDKFTDLAAHVDARELYWQSLQHMIKRLLASGKKVYLLYPIPELPLHITKAVTQFSILGDQTVLNLQRSTPTDYYASRNKFILNKLDSLSFNDDLKAIKPFDILCDGEFCPAVHHDVALYFDDDHLSIEGASLLLMGSVVAKDIMQNNFHQ